MVKKILTFIFLLLLAITTCVSVNAEEIQEETSLINYTGDHVIYKNINSPFTTADLISITKNNFTTVDNLDLRLSIVYDEYTGYGSKNGEYRTTLRVSYNEFFEDFDLTIKVVDNINFDVLYNHNIYVDSSTNLTKEQLTNNFKSLGILPNDNLILNYNSEYFNTPEKVGNYLVVYTYTSASGLSGSDEYNLIVKESQSYDIVEEEDTTFKDIILKVFKYLAIAFCVYLIVFCLVMIIIRTVRFSKTINKYRR